ncbi:MAG: hypothetical protein LBR25_09505 [Erysipelotrichaceae bacterium]|jgi:hypothetical protein|nr:hypothetical protein [Erysipelotrichaceae bacterium]
MDTFVPILIGMVYMGIALLVVVRIIKGAAKANTFQRYNPQNQNTTVRTSSSQTNAQTVLNDTNVTGGDQKGYVGHIKVFDHTQSKTKCPLCGSPGFLVECKECGYRKVKDPF